MYFQDFFDCYEDEHAMEFGGYYMQYAGYGESRRRRAAEGSTSRTATLGVGVNVDIPPTLDESK